MQTMTQPAEIRRLGPADARLMQALNALFGEAFEDADTYGGAPPSLAYIEGLLGKEHVIALVALEGEDVTGSDTRHFQLGAGVSAATRIGLTLVVDASVLGEQGLSIGASWQL